ncbi:MAG: hypothetical protein LBG98_00780 [Puniceicoccales bacterium]|jgi:hypothetical protein|nr:hypothetical protein [Puniceicoccales bacterium]
MIQHSSLSLIVMAAGMGSRFGGDKQITPIAPNLATFLEYTFYDALCSGINHAVCILKPEIETTFRERILRQIPKNFQCDIVHQTFPSTQRKKPWGTGHAILCAKDKIRDHFITVNADDFYGREAIQSLVQYLKTLSPGEKRGACITYPLKDTLSPSGLASKEIHRPHGCIHRGSMVQFVTKLSLEKNRIACDTHPLKDTPPPSGSVSRGICHCDERGNLREIIESEGTYLRDDGIITNRKGEDLPLDAPASMNLLGFTSAFLEILQRQWELFYAQNASSPTAEFGFPGVIRTCAEDPEWEIKIIPAKSSWIGITFREDLLHAAERIHAKIRQGLYPQPLWN